MTTLRTVVTVGVRRWLFVLALLVALWGTWSTADVRAASDDHAAVHGSRARGLYAANFGAASVTEYAIDASGAAAPLRTIRGPHTKLGGVRDVAVDRAGTVYAVNLSGPDFINVFARGASGDATPICTIGGIATMLSDPLAITLDAHGYLYVANQTEEGPPAASILVFAPGATGNVPPCGKLRGQARP